MSVIAFALIALPLAENNIQQRSQESSFYWAQSLAIIESVRRSMVIYCMPWLPWPPGPDAQASEGKIPAYH